MTDEEIWAKWGQHYVKLGIDPKGICRDGIIDVTAYRHSKPRILFVMREVNDFPEGDLRVMLSKGPKYQMWHTVARWASGILNGFPPFEEIDTWTAMKDSIRSIATINLKKITGGSTADMSIVNAFAFRDRDLLLEQIELIDPEIIIAAGTFDTLVWLLELEVYPEKPLDRPVPEKVYGLQVIPWRHPGRADNRETYEELKKKMQTT